MKKNESPNFINVRPKGTPWKFGFFFLWGLILFSNPMYALKEAGSGELADSIRTDNEVQTEANVLYIEKGAFVYGMENVTQTVTSSANAEKNISKTLPSEKKKTAVKKKEIKQKAEPEHPKLKVLVVLSSNPSEESFSLSKRSSAVATITVHQTLKLAVQSIFIDVLTTPFFITNSLYSNKFFWKEDISDSSILTRPPPFLVSI
ncbi:hypothetical protein ACN9MN_00985 [Chryseobacterium sp. S-02]|uniref:hypothetical protein n=1 Tax=Chryseobacterium sp. S-02 TaxID=3404064 RepID=UPI003CE7A3B2